MPADYAISINLAEEVGFEPTVPETGTPVFETGPFNHSGTPPGYRRRGHRIGVWLRAAGPGKIP